MADLPPEQQPSPDGFQPPTGPVPPGYYPPPSQPLYPPDQPVPPQYYESLPLHMQPPDWRLLRNPIRRINAKAEQAQMFGILSLFLGVLCGIPAIILGLMALNEIGRTGEDGSGKANAGLILGFLSIFTSCAFYALFLAR